MDDEDAYAQNHWADNYRYHSFSFAPHHGGEYLYGQELASGAIRKLQMVEVAWDDGGNLVFDLQGLQVVLSPNDPRFTINHSAQRIIHHYQPKKAEPMNENIELLNLLQAERGVKTCLVKTHSKTVNVFKIPPQLELALDQSVLVKINDDFRVGTIVGLHDEAEFDFDKPVEYDWVIQTLDLDPYNDLLEEEKSILRKLRRAAAYERLKRTVEAGGFDLDKIETPLLSSQK